MNQDQLRYPIGRFDPTQVQSAANRALWRKTIKEYPLIITPVAKQLSDSQLDTPYRPDGWTIRQVINHVADSHVNAYIRFKWTMTEESPLIKAYDEKSWAILPEAMHGDITPSLSIILGIHARLSALLDTMTDTDYERRLSHPEWDAPLSLGKMLSLYAWHSQHHLAHITHLAKRLSWQITL